MTIPQIKWVSLSRAEASFNLVVGSVSFVFLFLSSKVSIRDRIKIGALIILTLAVIDVLYKIYRGQRDLRSFAMGLIQQKQTGDWATFQQKQIDDFAVLQLGILFARALNSNGASNAQFCSIYSVLGTVEMMGNRMLVVVPASDQAISPLPAGSMLLVLDRFSYNAHGFFQVSGMNPSGEMFATAQWVRDQSWWTQICSRTPSSGTESTVDFAVWLY